MMIAAFIVMLSVIILSVIKQSAATTNVINAECHSC
jgi:hypothetical protein